MTRTEMELSLTRRVAKVETEFSTDLTIAANGVSPPLLASPERFINRELSWLEFNRRVLEESANLNHPLLERLRFLSISADNLDEFFMVRVAGLVGQVLSGVAEISDDGRTPVEQLERISERVAALVASQQARWRVLRSELASNGVVILEVGDLTRRERDWLQEYFLLHVFPILTPLAVDPAHPFPFIPNLGFTLALELLNPQDARTMSALVRIPGSVERFVRLPDGPLGSPARFVTLDRLIVAFIGLLFPGHEVVGEGDFASFAIATSKSKKKRRTWSGSTKARSSGEDAAPSSGSRSKPACRNRYARLSPATSMLFPPGSCWWRECWRSTNCRNSWRLIVRT